MSAIAERLPERLNDKLKQGRPKDCGSRDMPLVHLKLDTHIAFLIKMPAQIGGKTICRTAVRVVTPNLEPRHCLAHGDLPPPAKSRFTCSSRIIENTHICIAHLPVEYRRKAMHGDMDHALPALQGLGDVSLDCFPVRKIMVIEDRLSNGVGGRSRDFGEETRVSERAIEIDQEPCRGGAEEWGCKPASERAGEPQRTSIVAAVGVQKRKVGAEQLVVGCGDPIATVLAGDEEMIS